MALNEGALCLMLKISVCPIVVEDAAAIAALNESCFGRPVPTAVVEAQLKSLVISRENKLYGAVYRGQLIGYVHARNDVCTYRAPRKTVVALAVAKEYRRQGVATMLMDAVTKWAKAERSEAIAAMVSGSKAAQSFFSAYGCEERLNRKQYVKTVAEPKSPIVERLENNYGKKD